MSRTLRRWNKRLDLGAKMHRCEARPAAIREARERLAQRQRELDLEPGRSDDDVRRHRGPDGKPRGECWHRDFGVTEGKAHAEVDGQQDLHTAAMAAKPQSDEGKTTVRR